MKKFLLAYNPVSGNAMFKTKLDDIIHQFQKRDAVIIPYRTKKEQNDPAYKKMIEHLGIDGIVVAGGDGTLHKIINMTIKEEIDLPIGIFPSGTSNDFAVHLGIDDYPKYIDAIVSGNHQYVDIGSIGSEYFINVVSAGMMTSVAHEVDSKLKNTFGKLAYYMKGLGELPNMKGLNFSIEADGEVIEDKIYMVLISNSPVVASFKNISIKASINDGKLDMIIIRQCNIPEFVKIVKDTLSGKLVNNPNVIYKQAKEFTIFCPDEVESDLDGELGPKLPIHITTHEKALKIFMMP